MQLDLYKFFYEYYHRTGIYASTDEAEKHAEFNELNSFLNKNHLTESRGLEVGCARGAFQNLVSSYTGVDISPFLGKYIKYPNKFVSASGSALPFTDGYFDVCWSIYCLEHVPDLAAALTEIRRVVKKGGYIYLRPAYNVPRWVSTGVSVRHIAV